MTGNLNTVLPGHKVMKVGYHRPQTLVYKNGYSLARLTSAGAAQVPLSSNVIQSEVRDLSIEVPVITRGTDDQRADESFVPSYVTLDKKVLRYYAYFMERVLNTTEAERCVRPVIIYYYLENDTMCIIEPRVENSGMMQGMRVKRQRFPKNKHGEYYHWTDLNLGMDLEVYGFKYRIAQCDAFTKEFIESEGIFLNDPESIPVDPYTKSRQKPPPCHTTPSCFDKLYQFLTMDGKVLRFFAVWDDEHSLAGEIRYVIIHYYLVDDTVEIREVHERNSGRDAFPVLQRRERLPKKLKAKTFPSCVFEVSKEEVDEYYTPEDFQLGHTVTLLGRCFLLYDCDRFTREYYQENYPHIETKRTEVPKMVDLSRGRKRVYPPYNGFGSLEDSLQNCLHLIPQCPKKDVLKMMENEHKVLRYNARLDSKHHGDEFRRFVLSYFLSTDTISIFEMPTPNSGFMSGKFLEKTRIPKPGSTVEDPEFYSPADFAIGATVNIFGHNFVLTDADVYVLTYLESIADKIPHHTLESLRQKLGGLRSAIYELSD